MTSEPTDPPAERPRSSRCAPSTRRPRYASTRTSRRPAYVDLTSGDAQRRPIIPEHWRTWENAKRHVALAAARHGHRAAYHGVRSPGLLRQGARVRRLGRRRHRQAADRLVAHPRHDEAGVRGRRGRAAERSPAAAQAGPGDPQGARHDPGAVPRRPGRRRRRHGRVRAVVGVGAGRGRRCSSRSRWPGGRRARRSRRKAELPAQVQPPDQDVITRALGVARHRRDQPGASQRRARSTSRRPVREDGPGWRAEVDLPYGVTATQVIDRREQLASGLRRPLGAVWPEPVTHEHAGRLELWVGRADISKAKPPPWPLLRTGGRPTCSSRCRSAPTRAAAASTAPMIYHNWLIGSMPRPGQDRRRRGCWPAPPRSTRSSSCGCTS